MWSYSNFVELVKADGLARQNRFFIMIPPPRLPGATGQAFTPSSPNTYALHLLCKGVSVPGINVLTAPFITAGEPTEAPYGRSFGPASFSFYMDRGFMVRQFFDSWFEGIQNPDNRTMGFYDDFVVDINVVVTDKNGFPMYELTLFEAHPKTMGELSLDQGNNEVMVLDVTFDYRNYRTRAMLADTGPSFPPSGAVNEDGSGLQNARRSFENLYGGSANSLISSFRDDFQGYQRRFEAGLNTYNDVGTSIRGAITGVDGEAVVSGESRSYIR